LQADDDGQASVRAAFDVSYARLASPAQLLFRRLGLVPGPDVPVELAAALAELPTRQVRAVLERLAAAHLITERTPGRYAFHDLLRLYAAERCRAPAPWPRSGTPQKRGTPDRKLTSKW
jgi:hypothetical protein